MLLHIYCTKVLVVKLYYSTYISQLWSGDSNQISSKGGKRSNEGFRGGIIFLLYWPEHGCSSLTESSHALISPRCGDSSPQLPLNPPPSSVILEEENWVGPPVNEWEGPASSIRFVSYTRRSLWCQRASSWCWRHFLLEIIKKTVSPLNQCLFTSKLYCKPYFIVLL